MTELLAVRVSETLEAGGVHERSTVTLPSLLEKRLFVLVLLVLLLVLLALAAAVVVVFLVVIVVVLLVFLLVVIVVVLFVLVVVNVVKVVVVLGRHGKGLCGRFGGDGCVDGRKVVAIVAADGSAKGHRGNQEADDEEKGEKFHARED